MPKIFWVLAAVALAAAGCRPEGCSDQQLRLDHLLGGGLPVCLGGAYAQLGAHSDREAPSQVTSSPTFSVQEGPRRYSYEPAGGIDLVVFHMSGYIGRACIDFASGSKAQVDSVVLNAMRKLRGDWRKEEVYDGISRWTSTTRPNVHISATLSSEPTVCVSMVDQPHSDVPAHSRERTN
jgi:hypothetical protein